MTGRSSDEQILERGRKVLRMEAEAVTGTEQRLDGSFANAVRMLAGCQGRVIVSGVGKSGLIGRKIAATLTSTGTPATFLHPSESAHGDLGIVGTSDVGILISRSGESDELVALVDQLKRFGVPTIAIIGARGSALARHADVALDATVEKEACPLNLAPTASTTTQMALGDALAVALLDARGFREEDFARSHPGGALGRKLLIHVHDLMRQGDDLPRVGPEAGLNEVLRQMTGKGLGFTAVVDESDGVLGIFTDGDLRRLIERGADLRSLRASDVMHRQPRRVAADALAVEAADLMEQHRITSVLVVEGEPPRLVGTLNSNDLMRAKVI